MICPRYGPLLASRRLLPDYNPRASYLPIPEKCSIPKCFTGKLLCARRDLCNSFNVFSDPLVRNVFEEHDRVHLVPSPFHARADSPRLLDAPQCRNHTIELGIGLARKRHGAGPIVDTVHRLHADQKDAVDRPARLDQ